MNTLSGFLNGSSASRGVLSLDRCTILIYSPGLSLWQKDEDDLLRAEKKVALMSKMVEKFVVLDDDFCQGVPSELFRKHYRSSSGIDIQFGPVMPRRKKIKDESYILAFGTVAEKEKGFMYKSFPNDYAFRLEYNPNSTNLLEVSNLLRHFAGSGITADKVRIARIDIAIDYSVVLSPTLSICDGMRKSFIAVGSEGVETVYYGSRASKNFIRVYDKAREQREKFGRDTVGPLWRFELESKQAFFLCDPPDFGKVLQRFHFYSGGIRLDDWRFNLLVSYARDNGIKAALSFLPARTAARYKKLFDDFDVNHSIESPADCFYRDFPSKYDDLRISILTALGHRISENEK